MAGKTFELNTMQMYVIFLVVGLAFGGLLGYIIGIQQKPTEVILKTTTTTTTTTTQTTPSGIELVSECPGADIQLTEDNTCKILQNNTNVVTMRIRNIGSIALTDKHFKIFVRGGPGVYTWITDFYDSSKGLVIPAGGPSGQYGTLTIVADANQICTTYGVPNTCTYVVSLPCVGISKAIDITCSGS